MVANGIPYFHNNPGIGRVRVRAKKFMCAGDLPPFDHPHIFIDMGDDDEIVCPYCGTLFAFDPNLGAMCEPPECEFRPESVPEPLPSPSDISSVTAAPHPESASPLNPQADGAMPAPPQPELASRPTPKVAAATPMKIEITSDGVAASFETEDELRRAMAELEAANIDSVRTYTPKAVEGAPEKSWVPTAMLAAGLIGVCGMFAMEALANTIAYPWDIGGRPKLSWPSFVPIAFEVSVLCAMLGGFFAYLFAARIPKLYDPVDEFELMRDAMRNRWVVAIRTGDARMRERAREVLDRLQLKRDAELTA
ncbi:MAG: zinc-finger domain-containing protein [Methylocapsa sp.]|nr:zinc-finger domain-containing protein [Methylocapsa sp.]